MRFRISENEALKEALCDAYLAKENMGTGDEWQSQVMRRIRETGLPKTGLEFWATFERMVWRLAPVSCLLVLALAVFLLSMDLDRSYDYLGTVTAELEKPTLGELFGLEG